MKTKHIAGIIIIALAIGVIVSTYSDSSTYSTFTMATHQGELTHVIGKLDKNKEMHYNPYQNANLFSFYVRDKAGKECKVYFNGTKPQDFERSEEIVLMGKMVKGDFHAEKILMKCPSKYTNNKIETTEYEARDAQHKI